MIEGMINDYRASAGAVSMYHVRLDLYGLVSPRLADR
jgi:hypothetical protein